MPRLEWTESPGRRTVFHLTAAATVIGRRSDTDIVLTHPLASRVHARIVREGQVFVVTDLQSRHGTWVNGERVERRALRSRDRISLGQHGLEFVFLVADEQAKGESADTLGASVLDGAGIARSIRQLSTLLPEEPGEHSELEKVSCLLDFHYSFGKSFSADRTFQHVLKCALSISGAERGFILRKQEGEFSFEVGMDKAGNPLGQADFRTSRSVVDRVARTGEPVFMTQGIEGELAGSQSIVAMNLLAVACLPLEATSAETAGADVMGILYLDSREHMRSLSGLDERLLARLAEEAGHVLEKLDMIGALEERRRIEQDLAVAEETQRSLLPLSLPQMESFRVRAFCRPTRQLGGDFYDFIAVEGSALTGVLADVSGKGIAAALLSSFTLGALNTEFRSSPRPEAALHAVNQLLCAKTSAQRFVTLFLFQFDGQGVGQYFGAGHNPAYLFRAASGAIEELPSNGFPLGMFSFASYQPTPIQMHLGDMLIIYSDGLTEAENGARDEFGEERLLTLIKSGAPKGIDAVESALFLELDRFTQGAMQSDDITFLLIERR